MPAPTLLPWTFRDIEAFGAAPHRAAHLLHEQPMFTDDALADLLDRLPREAVHPYTMGTDASATGEWRRGEATDLPGKELLEVVGRGRLWLNLVGVSRYDAALAGLVADAYAEIGTLVPGFDPLEIKATLLISSPTAMVYYHADNQPNLLWHLRGRKRAYVYPRAERFASRVDLEKVVAGASTEGLPYDAGFDAHAEVLDLEPGQVAWWPQNCPHRVENLDGMNVSLSTEHWTPASVRRERVWTANHHLRERLGRGARSTREDGVLAAGKVAAMRVGRKAGLLRTGEQQALRPSFRIDPDVASGVGRL
ncbi:hypothetical protein [Pimelobacter simplex]|uniref:hypothetical protein n=1 Tax=Nocardioides simplex TaxID=2045 RepID=UPI0021505367|nr:hypothetical protein [Pimelobacter simplex]UUW89058.1 hypothetical protein M0M43_25455 [Pimelobacter simplex]UUW98562.1 hypothetical protein M0M48_14105 [Pimelobacter simplex]